MKNKIQNYIRASYPGTYMVSWEERRVIVSVIEAVKELKYNLFVWSAIDGVEDAPTGTRLPPFKHLDINGDEETIDNTTSPVNALYAFSEALPPKSVLLMRDFHLHLKEADATMIRLLKKVLQEAEGEAHKQLMILACEYHMPNELSKDFAMMEFSLPSKAELKLVVDEIMGATGTKLTDDEILKVVDATSGMTTVEATNALSMSYAETGKIVPEVVFREKCQAVKKNGLLEIVESKTTLNDIGGLQNLKEDVYKKRNLFTQAARDYGLPTPRPILIVGQPGTGKSLTASATRAIFGLPLIGMNAGKLFGGTVGKSEENWRSAFATAKAIAPCIVWVDECEMLTAGSESSGQCDGGTSLRVAKQMLKDLQENSQDMLWILTANDIDNLPDPLIDRCEVWSVDLPTFEERKQIIRIQIKKVKRDGDKFDLERLAKETEGFSGRQIEQMVCKGLLSAFNDSVREPTDLDFIMAAGELVPTSVTMAEAIEHRRKRLKNRAKAASIEEVKPQPKLGRAFATVS